MNDNYIDIVNDILKNKKFCKLKEEKHHENSNRYNHSLEVSYRTYKICKKLNLDYKSASKAALLHDFFFSYEFETKRKSLFNHSKKAIDNSLKITDLNKKEKNIIASHMFPVGGKIPKSIESAVVLLVDDYVSIKEKYMPKLKHIKSSLSFVSTIILTIIFK